jgi:hypothetical protein
MSIATDSNGAFAGKRPKGFFLRDSVIRFLAQESHCRTVSRTSFAMLDQKYVLRIVPSILATPGCATVRG